MSYEDVNFTIYIRRLLKATHEGIGLTGDAVSLINNIIRILISGFVTRINKLMIHSKNKKTIDEWEVEYAILLHAPEGYCKDVVASGKAAVERYKAAKAERIAESQRRRDSGEGKLEPAQRAGLAEIFFPITRIDNIMVQLASTKRRSGTSAVMLTAAIEHIIKHILQLAGSSTSDNKRVRIIPRHIKMAIEHDPHLNQLFKNVIMSGGVQQIIPAEFLEAKKTKKVKPTKAKVKATPKATSVPKAKGAPKVAAKTSAKGKASPKGKSKTPAKAPAKAKTPAKAAKSK